MVLSDRDIIRALVDKRIVIDPDVAQNDIQPASIDLHLGTEFRAFNYDLGAAYQLDTTNPHKNYTEAVIVQPNDEVYLDPGNFILGVTAEHIELKDTIVGRLDGRSSLGRMGLLIHITAGYVDPGWRGRLTLEIANVSPYTLVIRPGQKICQISFMELTSPVQRPYGSMGLGSHYQFQERPEEAKK